MEIEQKFNYLKDNIKEFDHFKADILNDFLQWINYLDNLAANNAIFQEVNTIKLAFNLIFLFTKQGLVKEENFVVFNRLAIRFINEQTATKFNYFSSNLLRELFELYNKLELYENGLRFFNQFVGFYNVNTFSNVKAFVVYFAYQLKSYSHAQKILEAFYMEFKSDSYEENYEYCMMNFYKGLIYLSKNEFYKASIFFMFVFKAGINNNIYNHFHVEAMKRLYLLNFIVDPIYRTNINMIINSNKKFAHIKPLDVYSDIYKFFGNKCNSYKDAEKIIRDNVSKFKADKTNGLVKLCLTELAFKNITNTLKVYKQIRLEKLSNMLDIEKNLLLRYLKNLTYSNRLNVKYNEVEDIIENFESNFDLYKNIQILKQANLEINSIQSELLNLVLNKSEDELRSLIAQENANLKIIQNKFDGMSGSI